MAEQITGHTDEALERLCEQFKGHQNIADLLTALTGSVQEVETVLWDLLTDRAIDTATGVHLEAIGAKVGQDRNGMIDETYRRFIRARIATNRSRGTAGDILRIASLVLDEPNAYLRLENQGAAAYVLRVQDVDLTDDLADVLIDFLREATAAGVRAIVEYSEDTPMIWDVSNWEGAHVWARAID